MTTKRNRVSKQNPVGRQFLQLHGQVASDSLQRLLAAPVSSGITTLVIAIALFLPALLYLVSGNLTAVLAGATEDTRLVVYLESSISSAQQEIVSDYLQTEFGSDSVGFTSADQALENFSQSAEVGDLLTSLPSNPLPASFVVIPDIAATTNIDALVDSIEALEGVELVQLDRLWLQRLRALSNLLALLSRVLGLIVVVGLVAIVGNTIKLSIEHRRREIQVIKLIGGGDSYIVRPFLYTGLLLGFAGGCCASILVGLMGLSLAASVAELSELFGSDWRLASLTGLEYLMLTLSGAGIGWLAAVFASYRNIATIEP